MRRAHAHVLFAIVCVTTPASARNRTRRFSEPSYWEETYKASGKNSTYEWFLKSEAFVDLIKPYVKQDDKVVQLGCGNSRVAEVLAAEGYRDVTSIDVSPSVIEASIAKHPPDAFPALKFVVGDVFALTDHADGSYDAALDKGTWDAIAKPRSKDMLKEVRRVLRRGGVYLVLTFSRPANALDFLLDWRVGWKVEDMLTVANPLHDGKSESLKYFYLYVCRNEDRDDNWVPIDVSPGFASAVDAALSFQSIDKDIFGKSSEL